MQEVTTNIDLGVMVTGLGGGLAMFLFGMRHMTEALKTVAGASMQSLLSRLTANRFTGAAAGAIMTAVIQSSSVTTVLTVGFLSAGLMTFPQSIGVIIGANVGTTVTAQLVAFRIDQYGLLMIAIGFLIEISAKRVRVKQYGTALMGLGLLFFGMELMSSAMGPLRTYPGFLDILARMQNPFLGLLAGLLFTAIVQSSSATTGIVIVMAAEGLIPLESGIALVFGANVGTCVTAILSSIGQPRAARQAAAIHVVFNALGVMLWVLWIPQIADLIRSVTPEDASRQIANAHTLFNVGNTLLFIWFVGPLARLVDRIVPEDTTVVERSKPLYLDEYFINQPPMALDRVRMELGRLSRLVTTVLRDSFTVMTIGGRDEIDRLRATDEEINSLHGAIVAYLGRISGQNLVESQQKRMYRSILMANDLETIGDVVDKNLMSAARKRVRLGFSISAATREQIRAVHEQVCSALETVTVAIESGDTQAALDATRSKGAVNKMARQSVAHMAARLTADEPNRLAAFSTETDIIENLKRINNVTRRLARIVVGEQAQDNSAPNRAAASGSIESSAD